MLRKDSKWLTGGEKYQFAIDETLEISGKSELEIYPEFGTLHGDILYLSGLGLTHHLAAFDTKERTINWTM